MTSTLIRRMATVSVATTMTLSTVGVLGGTAFADVDQGRGTAHEVKTSPQPASTADFSGHGANQHGPYDSTRDGSPSANGNGGGEAKGKPCAGCVGKADNKNPHGQLPGPSDTNAGYECDTNHGIGRGNPAHTGCTATDVVAPADDESTPDVGGSSDEVADGDDRPDDDGVEASDEGSAAEGPDGDSVGAGSVDGCPSAEKMSGDVDPETCIAVLGESASRPTAGGTMAPTAPVVRGTAAALPFTGAPVGVLLVLAGVLLAAGAGLLLAMRRRPTATA